MANLYRNHPRAVRLEPSELKQRAARAEAQRKELHAYLIRAERMTDALVNEYQELTGALMTKYADLLNLGEEEPATMIQVAQSVSNLTTDFDDLWDGLSRAIRALGSIGMTVIE